MFRWARLERIMSAERKGFDNSWKNRKRFMNLSGDEKRIRQLFLELRLEEERRAPAFAGVLRAMVSGTTRRQQRNVSIKLALAATALIVFVLAAIAIVRQSEGSRPSNIKQATVEKEAPPSPIPDSAAPLAPKP